MATMNPNNNNDQMAANSIRGNDTGAQALGKNLTVDQTLSLLNTGTPYANANISSMTGLTGAIKAPVSIQSAANENVIAFAYAASAVNYLLFGSNATGLPPVINAVGADTNIDLNIGGKGTGALNIRGASTNSTPPSGYVGEVISSRIVAASAVSCAAITPTNITSISLTAGDWDVYGNVSFPSMGASNNVLVGWVSTTSASLPDQADRCQNILSGSFFQGGYGVVCPSTFLRLAATTTVYLSAYSQVAATGCGNIFARRAR